VVHAAAAANGEGQSSHGGNETRRIITEKGTDPGSAVNMGFGSEKYEKMDIVGLELLVKKLGKG
jgi:hypothetical protein